MHFTRYLLYLHVCCESCIWPSFLVFLSVSYVITFMTMIPVIICNILWCHQSIGCLPCTWPRAHWCPSCHAPDAWRGCGSMSVEASSARRNAPMSRCNAVSITIYVGWDTCVFLYLNRSEILSAKAWRENTQQRVLPSVVRFWSCRRFSLFKFYFVEQKFYVWFFGI